MKPEGKHIDKSVMIVSTVSRQLTERFGKGYQRANLFRMLKVARVFPDEETVSTTVEENGGTGTVSQKN